MKVEKRETINENGTYRTKKKSRPRKRTAGSIPEEHMAEEQNRVKDISREILSRIIIRQMIPK